LANTVPPTFNPYAVLGVKENASLDEIKAVFRKKSKECHPDQRNNETSQEFLNLKKAYDILMSREKRNSFDEYGVVVDFEEEARKLAFTVFLNVVSECEKEDLLDAEIRDFIEIGLLPKYEEALKNIEAKIGKLKYRLNSIVKKPDDDFITGKGLKTLEEYYKEYRLTLLQRDLHKAALELLRKYKFDFDRLTENTKKTVKDARKSYKGRN